MAVESCLYFGETWHGRFIPKKNQFKHTLFTFWINLDELNQFNLYLFKYNRLGIYAFYEQDYFPTKSHLSLKERVINWISQQDSTLNTSEIKSVFLLAQPKVMGYCYNPVAFYYCFDQNKKAIAAVAEVTNTFYERKLFYIPISKNEHLETLITKHFYVSPFSSVEEQFEFILKQPNEKLEIRVNTLNQNNETLIKASLTGQKIALSDANLLKLTLRHPWITVQTMLQIHAHAFILWLKKIPFFAKETSVDAQKDVINAHKSIRKA